MTNTLNWKVPSRAQSAASVAPAWTRSSAATPPPLAAVESADPLWGVDFSPQYNNLYSTNSYSQSPASSSSYSGHSRPPSGQSGRAAPCQPNTKKKYWELGGLGPTSVATPEWQLHKERWMAKKAFGKAATAANRLARLRALGRMHQEKAEHAVEEEVELNSQSIAEEDESVAMLDERAKKRDIALALKL